MRAVHLSIHPSIHPHPPVRNADRLPSPPQLKARILRAESAFANGLETIGLYAAAVVAVNIGGSNGSNGGVRVNPRAANALSLAYLLTRVVYTVIYVVLQDPTRDGGDGGRDGEEGGGGGEAEDDDDADTVTPESVAAAAALALAGKVGKVGADSPADGRGSESEVKAEEGRMLAEETGGGGKRRRLRPRRRRGGGGGGGRGRARSALPRSGAWALARSATWFAGIGVIFAMFTLAGAATYDA